MNENTPRILFIEPAGAGGIAHCTYALARALGQSGTECDILTGSRWIDRPLPESVRIHRIFNGMRTNPIRLWLRCFHLRRRVDIVHWQCSTYPRLILALMRTIPLKSLPWVYTVHNVLPHEVQTDSLDLYGQTYRRLQGLIFHTQHSRNLFQEWYPDIHVSSEIIPLGEYGFLIDGQPNSGDSIPTTYRPVILFFGNIRHYKGLDILIRALARIRQRISEVQLLIAGQPMGSFEPYEKLIRELQLESNVETRFGYIPDREIPALLNSAAVAALPYRDIYQSAALMLMLAYGKATVATQVGGISETIRHGETGLLVPPENPAALADAIVGLLLDHTEAQRLGDNARRDARDRFSWERIAEQTQLFYREIVQSSRTLHSRADSTNREREKERIS